MPEIHVYLAQGRSLEQKRKVAGEITEAIVRNLDVPPEVVVVQFIESSRDSKARGGVLFSDRDKAAKANSRPSDKQS
jgi:4-oxalocrotonate tautomerase